jgi:alkylation response protein AidB-like acyl-CoA dehydrogenase
VRFAFTAEQIAIRDTVRALLARECTGEHVRAAWGHDDGRVPGLWAKLAELGVPGMLAPEGAGGLGLGEVDLVLALEESGRVALPEPLLETAAVAVPALRDGVAGEGATSGAAQACDRWLRAIAAGEAVAAVSLDAAGDGWVAGLAQADVALVGRGGELLLVEAPARSLEHHRSVDGSRRLARWTSMPPSTCLAVGEAAAQAIADARDRAAVGSAAQLVGLARGMLQRTVDYVKTRHQFGKPVGSFQAVKHHLADALVAVEMAAPAVYRGAYSIAQRDPARSTHASMAKALASDAAGLVARKALQCHGAIGYAFENDLQLWMKRAWALSAAWGDAAWHRERVGRAIFEDRTAAGDP